jgi:hypothetical protein
MCAEFEYKNALRIDYGRAMRLTQSDEHLHFNIARTLLEKDKRTAPIRFVNIALEFNPDFVEGKKLLAHLQQRAPEQSATQR